MFSNRETKQIEDEDDDEDANDGNRTAGTEGIAEREAGEYSRPLETHSLDVGWRTNETEDGMITLGVSNLEKSKDFYKNGLGLPTHGDYPGVVFFKLTGTWLGLFPEMNWRKTHR